jgi:hypothetical protein
MIAWAISSRFIAYSLVDVAILYPHLVLLPLVGRLTMFLLTRYY